MQQFTLHYHIKTELSQQKLNPQSLVVSLPKQSLVSVCPSGNLSKTCTADGWTPISMDSYILDCGYNPNSTMEENSVSAHVVLC